MQSVTNQSCQRRAVGGFTLIELIVVALVISILALLALPVFTESIRKSRRAEAISLLNQVAQQQERWRANCSSYASNLASAPGGNCTGGLGVANTGNYTLSSSFPAASSISYAATASAVNAQVSDAKCRSLTMRVNGGNLTYSSSGTAASSVCWSR
jgi:type IV pilus assembly protein PilE